MPTQLTFSIDTHIFRELGELLVGRDSTALVELLKNAYDADATRVTVYGENLQNTERGLIRISDNGHGMTAKKFVDSFLRIASRAKDIDHPLSPRFRRRFTGAKGIGRLAAHKLARVMEIESVYADPDTQEPTEGFRAVIDWKRVESVVMISDIPPDAVLLTE